MSATLGATVVLFGGTVGETSFNDTWTWDGVTWTQAMTLPAPEARGSAAIATVGSTVVMFGGLDQAVRFLDDTWAWNGAVWTQSFPAAAPSARTWPRRPPPPTARC